MTECDLVLVDFDDTLVETAPAFHAAREALFSRLEEEGFSREEVERVHHNEVEPELLALFGMGPSRMEPSFRDTYLRLCRNQGRAPKPEVAEECARLGQNFLGHPRVLEGSLEALERLARRFPTAVFSQASHPEYQRERIRDAGVTRIVGEGRVWVTPVKTPESLRITLEHFGVTDPARATVVGNSLRSDINPALLLGARAILVEPYEMWHYDVVPPVSDNYLRFTTFPEAADFLLQDGAAL